METSRYSDQGIVLFYYVIIKLILLISLQNWNWFNLWRIWTKTITSVTEKYMKIDKVNYNNSVF